MLHSGTPWVCKVMTWQTASLAICLYLETMGLSSSPWCSPSLHSSQAVALRPKDMQRPVTRRKRSGGIPWILNMCAWGVLHFLPPAIYVPARALKEWICKFSDLGAENEPGVMFCFGSLMTVHREDAAANICKALRFWKYNCPIPLEKNVCRHSGQSLHLLQIKQVAWRKSIYKQVVATAIVFAIKQGETKNANNLQQVGSPTINLLQSFTPAGKIYEPPLWVWLLSPLLLRELARLAGGFRWARFHQLIGEHNWGYQLW